MDLLQRNKWVFVFLICFANFILSTCSLVSEDSGFHSYEFTGRHDFLEDFFTLGIDLGESPYIDQLHRLNPDVFVVTNLTEPFSDRINKKYFIKSPDTGVVYECKVQKGIKIRTGPFRN